MITVRNLTKRFGGQTVLDGIDLEVAKGETVALLGPSGSGKTTLLRCLNGLERFDEGEVDIDGVTVRATDTESTRQARLTEVRRRCGFVFQQYHLFPHRSVLRNVTLAPMNVLGDSREAAESRAMELLAKVGLADKAGHRTARCSGGEQQRVAIARALAMRPDYLLYDEPTSALDPSRAQEMWGIMRTLAEAGQTQIVVTHQEELTQAVACRVVRMAGGRLA